MAETHASHPSNPGHHAPEPAPSKSTTYAGFAVLAILFIAMIAYSYTQFSAIQIQLNRAAPAADRLAGIDARLTQLEASAPKPAQLSLLYDSSCAFCDNAQLLDDAKSWNYQNAPKGLELVPNDVSGKLDLVRNNSIPFLPVVLVPNAEARRNGASWDLVQQQGAHGPIFVQIAGGFYGGLSTEGTPRPLQLLGPSCKQGDKLTVDYFYGLRCPLCTAAKAALDAYKQVLGDKLVVREHCLPQDKDEAQACIKQAGADAANQTAQLMGLWGIGYSPTTVFDCQYAQSSASLQAMTDRVCAVRPELCDALRGAKVEGSTAPAPSNSTAPLANATNATR